MKIGYLLHELGEEKKKRNMTIHATASEVIAVKEP